MRHPKLKEITVEEIQNNIEKYYNNRKQFFVKIKHAKALRTAYLYRFDDWDDDLEQEIWSYRFEYDDDDDGNLDHLDEGYIQHIYILK